MTIEFTKFIGKAPTLEAIQLTEENVEELAVWMGANSYSIEKVLVGGEQQVVFKTLIGNDLRTSRTILYAAIGKWIVKMPDMTSGTLREISERYWCVDQIEIDNFVRQQRDNGEIDFSAAPYDR